LSALLTLSGSSRSGTHLRGILHLVPRVFLSDIVGHVAVLVSLAFALGGTDHGIGCCATGPAARLWLGSGRGSVRVIAGLLLGDVLALGLGMLKRWFALRLRPIAENNTEGADGQTNGNWIEHDLSPE
jgi:hypothetical protein